MDRFGLDNILSFEDRVDTVAKMCARGHADKMVLAHDASCHIDWLPEAALPLVLPNWHYLHIHNDVLPALRQRGVTEDQIDHDARGQPAGHLLQARCLCLTRSPRSEPS